MIEWLLWKRFQWRQKRGKSAACIYKGRVWIISEVKEFNNV